MFREARQETGSEAALRHAWKKALKSAGLGAEMAWQICENPETILCLTTAASERA